MYQIDNASAATSLPAISNPGTPGFFTDGNPATGQAPTVVPAEWLNTVMMELSNAVSASGQTPTKGQLNQLARAIQMQAAPFILDSGSANAYVTSLPVVVTARTEGQVIRFKAKTTNTGASTINDGLGVVPLVGGAHQPLQGGEIVASGDAWAQWNSSVGASGSYILLEGTGGALQVGNATQSSHAINLGQGKSLFASGLAASQSASMDTPKQPGLYQYDGSFSGVKPPDNSTNYRTIEIGSPGRYSQIAMPFDTDNVFFRRQVDSSVGPWRTLVSDANIANYAPSKNGSNATGTWPINITGQANSVASVTAQQIQSALAYAPAYGQPASQSASMDTPKQPGLYQYDGSFSGVKPPDNSTNYRTIEIGSPGRYSQIAMPFDTDNVFFRRQVDSSVGPWRTLVSDANISGFFPASSSQTGYTKLPNGILFQWGSVTVGDVPGAAPGSQGTVTFPIRFPSTVVGVYLSITDANATTAGATVGAVSYSQSQNGFSWSVREFISLVQNCSCQWFAIGY
ncbi:gp53-like domain-containing protein [Chromobacterium violaceum]|uniref:gp53-like domain-containing protein n=1 Tax=Chromobacterium violaceum TaxID=536 RepID=UPI001CE11570|nr:hypothetical protein [Chromobacterium violaceum]